MKGTVEYLIGWTDDRSQRASYTLDAAGNATLEQWRNNGGALALQIRRSISALNRVQSETWGTNVTQTYTQDPNGELASVSNALGETTRYGRDALERINRITDAAGASASLSYNAQDAVTQVIDFKYVATGYTRDVQGNARAETTPDAGASATTVDALGLPNRIVDALGRASAITRDALGRPTLITHSPAPGAPSGSPGAQTLRTELRYDLSGSACNASGQANASKGRLCEMIDRVNGVVHATTQYQWDAFGRLTAQTQTLSSAIANHSTTQTTRYAYMPSGGGGGGGELRSITYPSGSVLTYQYDSSGQLTGLNWGGHPLLRDIRYNALGQPLSWLWEFADTHTNTALNASRNYNTAGQLTHSEFASFTPDVTGRVVGIRQYLAYDHLRMWHHEFASYTAQYNPIGQLIRFSATSSVPRFQWTHTYGLDTNGNRTSTHITAPGSTSALNFSDATQGGTNRLSTALGVTVATNAAGEVTSLLGKTLAYDAAGRLAEATAVPPCPTGIHCSGPVTTLSRFNGWRQRVLRETDRAQTVFTYGQDGHNLLSQTTRVAGSSELSTTELIYLPTASGAMPVAAVINGVHHAVHSDHLNTPRRLSDAAGQTRWQWPYSGYGEIAPQATPATGQAAISFDLRYPGQLDDGNGLFYNWNRFYDPRVGRYTSADPIGLEGGWNRFGYGNGNPMMYVDPMGLFGWADMPTVPQGAVNFGAGLGDALLLGTGGYLRELTGVYGGVDPCSGAYEAGAWTSFGLGAGRLAYAGIAKGGAYFASSGVQASAFRQRMKSAFRFGAAKNWRPPDLSKYPTDAALRDAAGRTNPSMNAYGTGVGGAGAAGAMCGCPN